MAAVLKFPVERRPAGPMSSVVGLGPAEIIILPVVRIERHAERPDIDLGSSRRDGSKPRRRRARR